MNKIFPIFLVFLLISQTLTTELNSQTPWSTIFTQVSEKSQFGKSMGSLIQMHIHALANTPSDRVTEIRELIQEIYSMYSEHNEREAERIAGVREECSTEIESFSAKLKEAEDQLQDNQSEREELLKEQGEKRIALVEEQANLDQMKQDLAQAQQDLIEENESFEVKQRDYNALIVACEAGVDLLLNMIHGEDKFKYGQRNSQAFVQIASVKDQFANVLQDFNKHSSLALLEPVLNSLVSISTSNQINYEQFLQCIELLQDILSRLRQDLTILTNRHEQIVSDLNTLISNLNQWIQISLTIIDIYVQRLQEIEARLAELVGLIDEVQQLIKVLSQTLANIQADCQAQDAAYIEAQAVRDQELATMEQLIEYFEKQVSPAVTNVREDALTL